MTCHCGSGINFSQCCEPFLKGSAQPQTAEALMRSRYTAHVVGDITYIKNTLTPEARKRFVEKDVKEWAKSEWLGLNVIAAQGNTVEFIAKYRADGKVIEHHEVAKFRKQGDRWFFAEGDSHTHAEGQGHHHHPPQTPIVREAPKVGRNDPCTCGSGLKYKKCHGAA
ncbi:MAG: SEC-C domain-containing protein [Bdellovibrionales bacterium]|nr:SEC-C domain-containing protein [Bdellovibrionales bacterium]